MRCRPIGPPDRAAVIDVLVRGFPGRPRTYWEEGLARTEALQETGAPRLGYLLEAGGEAGAAEVVGVLLTLYHRDTSGPTPVVRCNLSSWHVEPPYSAYASLLERRAAQDGAVTFFNISALRRTWPIHAARGYARYGRGQFVAFPLLSRARPDATVRPFAAGDAPPGLTAGERTLLADHAALGCLCLVGTDAAGSVPFVLLRRPGVASPRTGGLRTPPYLQLVYCRATDTLRRFARPLGRHLLAHHAMPWLMVDATGPMPGLAGFFVEGWGSRLARGPVPMRLGDLAYSELVLFGP